MQLTSYNHNVLLIVKRRLMSIADIYGQNHLLLVHIADHIWRLVYYFSFTNFYIIPKRGYEK